MDAQPVDAERRRGPVLSVLILIIALLLGLNLIFGNRGPDGSLIGKPAPDFVLHSAGGERVSLSALRGKVVVLDFWATWCGPCVRKMPELEALQRELGPRGVRVLGINIEGNRDLVAAFIRERALSLTMLVDEGQVAGRYAVQAIPLVVVVDRAGVVRHSQGGGATMARLRGAIEAALR